MTWNTKPTRFNLKLVRSVRKALAKGEACGLDAKSYHLLAAAIEDGRQEIYTVWLVRDDEGTCMGLCPELPEVLVFEDSEGEAIAAVQVAIEEAFAARGRSSDPAPALAIGSAPSGRTATFVLGQLPNGAKPSPRLPRIRQGSGKVIRPTREQRA